MALPGLRRTITAMPLLANSRRRNMALLMCGSVLVFLLLGTLQWFNTSGVDFFDPRDLWPDAGFYVARRPAVPASSSSADHVAAHRVQALCRRRQQRAGSATALAHGDGRGADRADPRRFHVPLQLSADESLAGSLVFSDNAPLRDDSSRVVRGLAQYVIANARVEASRSPPPARSIAMRKLIEAECALRIALLWSAVSRWSTTRTRRCWPIFRSRPPNSAAKGAPGPGS